MIRTSQFDSQPHTIRIVGSSAPAAETKLDSLYGDVEG